MDTWRVSAGDLARLVASERELRAETTVEDLWHRLTNDMQKLLGFERAFVIGLEHTKPKILAVTGINDVAERSLVVDAFHALKGYLQSRLTENCYVVHWHEIASNLRHDNLDGIDVIDRDDVAQDISSLKNLLSGETIWWVPLRCRERVLGGWWVVMPPQSSHPAVIAGASSQRNNDLAQEHVKARTRFFLAGLADCAGHAWGALTQRKRQGWLRPTWWWLAGLLVMGGLAIPIPRSLTGTARIVAADPTLVTAPLSGVIQELAVRPGQEVRAGDPLFWFDSARLMAERDLSLESLHLAQIERQQANAAAFSSRDERNTLAARDVTIALRKLELEEFERRLRLATVVAPIGGIVLMSNPSLWRGKPVDIGERVLQVAPLGHVEIQIDIPVSANWLPQMHTPVDVFLAVNTLHVMEAKITQVPMGTITAENGVPVYRFTATLTNTTAANATPALGLEGVARVIGQSAPIGLLLLLPVLTEVRQWFGL